MSEQCSIDEECPRAPLADGACWWHGVDPASAAAPSGVRLSEVPPIPGRYAGAMPPTGLWATPPRTPKGS